MADNLKKRGGADRARINVNQDHELRNWARKFGVTEEQLKDAVKIAGPIADEVQLHLQGSIAKRSF